MGDDYDEEIYIPRDDYDDDYSDYESNGEYTERDTDDDISSDESEEDMKTIDPSDFTRISVVQGTEIEEGRKSLRGPREVSLERLRGAFGDNAYTSIRQDVKNSAYNLVYNMPESEMITYNIDILTPAVLFVSMFPSKNRLTSKNVSEFMKQTSNLQDVNHLDFIRYIRMLSR